MVYLGIEIVLNGLFVFPHLRLILGGEPLEGVEIAIVVGRVEAEVAPAVIPRAILEGFVASPEGVHYLISLLALSEVHSCTVNRGERIELDRGMLANVVDLDEKRGEPDGVRISISADEVEVTLSVKDVRALIFLVNTDAVGVLKKNYVSTVMYHFVSHIIDSRGGIMAVFLTAVIDYRNVICVLLCLANILHCEVGIVGIASASVGECVRILVLGNVYNAEFLSLSEIYVVNFTRVLIVFANARVRKPCVLKCLESITVSIGAIVKKVPK